MNNDESNWRPLPDPHREPTEAEPVEKSVRRWARSLVLGDPNVLKTITQQWNSIVGQSVADHVQPASLRDRVLSVTVDDQAWITQLRYMEHEIIQRLDALIGENAISEIRPLRHRESHSEDL